MSNVNFHALKEDLKKSNVILVDENDAVTGFMEKMEAHEKGLRHRAFSVFILNSNGEILLQKRASGKYHSPGLWTNTCCSHPFPEENIQEGARRRLMEEMKLNVSLKHVFTFQYKAEFENNLIENEIDHVFIGFSDEKPELNPEEAEDWKYVSPETLEKDINNHPEDFTIWLRICYDEFLRHLKS